ncbi:MAG: glycosyltransferase 87 family protein [Chloroflexota bacterium]|nr:glycosyltransferase 87 family protein [Chloroflexota bacterium]
MLPLEYPPLTLVLFSLAQLAPIGYYQLAFAFMMALVALFIYWLLLQYGSESSWLAFALYALIGGWATAEGRFDLVPAALTLLCVIAAERKHRTLAYSVLALGVLIKIYPLLLLPPLFIAEQRSIQRFYIPSSSLTFKNIGAEIWHTLRQARAWKWKNALIFFSIIVGITSLFALLDFHGAVISQFNYFAERPVQIESTGSTLLWLATFFGVHTSVSYTFGSINILSPLNGSVSLLFEISFVLGYIYVIWLQWREKLDIVQASIAILLVFIITGKVFSPQYLIWLMPLLAYSGAFNYLWLLAWGSISALTTIIYPYLYTREPNVLHVQNVPGFTQAIAIRNTLFLLLTLAYLFNWFHIRRRRPLPVTREEQEIRTSYVKTSQNARS